MSSAAIDTEFDTDRPLLIVGNGPSAAQPRYDLLPSDPIVFRMNWFFLEDHFYYGRRVDAFLYSIPHAQLEQHLEHVVAAGWYDVGTILSPMLVPLGRADEPHASTLGQAGIPQGDHWAAMAENPQLARFMMGRPLPTQGMQALGAALQLGFTDITLVGIDMYASAERRYGHVVPDAIQATLDIKDLTPGYENSHSLDRDLEFLDTCLAQFPAAEVTYIGPSPHLQARLLAPQAGDDAGFDGVPGPVLASRPKPTFEADGTSAAGGLLRVRESDPLPSAVIDGKRCGYVTMVSGPTFHHGARALARSLRATTDVPLLALCTPSADAAALRASGIATLDVSEIVNPNVLGASTQRFSSTFTKLHAFRLTHLDRLVFLDSDMIVLRNLDELFGNSGFAAVYDHGVEYHYDRFNSGLFAVDPSTELFDRLLAAVQSVTSYDGGDQGFLNEAFADWERLPHEFNVNKRWSTLHPLAFNLAQTRVLHFVGVKPWQPDLPGEFDELMRLWYDQLDATELADLARSLRTEAALAVRELDAVADPVSVAARAALGRGGRIRRSAIAGPVPVRGSLLRRSQALVAAGASTDALTLLEHEWPGDDVAGPGLHRERAKALLLTGDLDTAYAALDEAALRFPDSLPIQTMHRRLTPTLRVLGRSRGWVPRGAVRAAARWYARGR